jgi:hypothetical protein
VRLGAVTHSFNMDQRWQELDFETSEDGLRLTAPASANDAPPGVYYVFLLGDRGVPSKAAILSIAHDRSPLPPPPPPDPPPPADPLPPADPPPADPPPAAAAPPRQAGAPAAAPAAAARARIMRLSPATGARAVSTRRVSARFAAPIGAGSIRVRRGRTTVSVGRAVVGPGGKELRVGLRRRLAPGRYSASMQWRAAGGATERRTWTFTLR